jgi:hypothetical protein
MSTRTPFSPPSAFTTARPSLFAMHAVTGCSFATPLIPSVPKSLFMAWWDCFFLRTVNKDKLAG